MPDVKWVGNHLEVAPPKKPKKLTGTRFASVLGLSPWATPFETWCAVTRTWEEEFKDTIYTKAGKIIEPKQAEYMKNTYMFDRLVTPTDKWGPDYFEKTWGDFFPDVKVFGGMWDYLQVDENGDPTAVYEMKTTKRAEDWAEDVPEYYALQAALYAHLLGVDQVYMVCSLLRAEDYDHPEAFVPNVNNTFIRAFRVSERYPGFERLMKLALDWWNTYVMSGISPDYDERKDAKVLQALRKVEVPPSDHEALDMLNEAEQILAQLDRLKAEAAPLEARMKELNANIKAYLQSQLKGENSTVRFSGPGHTWTLKRNISEKLDEQRLKDDHLYELYLKQETGYRLTVAQNKEE